MAEKRQSSGFVNDWQNGKTLSQCNLHMFETEDFCDVSFRVGSERQVIRAHRYVLVSRSCVFNAMFCGQMAEQGEIIIPDIEADVFKDFLRFLYTDNAVITTENAPGLHYTSDKYDVHALVTQCASFLEKSLTEEKVCDILENCHGYGAVDIEEKALKLLRYSGEIILKSPGFKKLCPPCFEKFLSSDDLCLKEEDVFEATLAWAKERCKEENLEPSPENQRKVLGKMIHQIRFPAFSIEYMITTVREAQILRAEERMLLVDRVRNSDIDISPFVSTQRKGVARYVKRFRTDLLPLGYPCKNVWDSIAFSTNKNIQLIGFQLYGPEQFSPSRYTIDVKLYDSAKLISEPYQSTDVSLNGGKGQLNDVLFPEPVNISAGRQYDLSVCLRGDPCCWGKGGTRSMEVDGVVFKFMPSYIHRTSVDKGQIPGIIWRPSEETRSHP